MKPKYLVLSIYWLIVVLMNIWMWAPPKYTKLNLTMLSINMWLATIVSLYYIYED